MFEISKYRTAIDILCRSCHVKELYIFGSSLSPKFSVNSDIDLLVDFEKLAPAEYTAKYFDLKFSLENMLGRTIDLLERKSLTNPYLISEIDSTKQLLYAA